MTSFGDTIHRPDPDAHVVEVRRHATRRAPARDLGISAREPRTRTPTTRVSVFTETPPNVASHEFSFTLVSSHDTSRVSLARLFTQTSHLCSRTRIATRNLGR